MTNEMTNETTNEMTNEKVAERLEVTSEAKQKLIGATKWMKFVNILSCVYAGILVIGGLLVIANPFLPSEMRPRGIACLIGFAIILPFIVKIFTFIRQARTACRNNDSEELCRMFATLKFLYKYVGILCIIVLAINIIAFFLGVTMSAIGQ